MRRRISSDKPMKDDWDQLFYDIVRDKVDNIFEGKRNVDKTGFQRYYGRYSEVERNNKRHGGKKKYMGMIANARDKKDLMHTVERKINNRSSVDLTDLHEFYLCTGIHPDTIFNIHETEDIVQLKYLSSRDIQKLSQNIRNLPEKVPIVVQCIPLLGLYLVVQADNKDRTKQLIYKIIDSFGIFSWPIDSLTRENHTFVIPDSPMDGDDEKMKRTIEHKFNHAMHIFESHCNLAKGILTNRNNQPIDRYKALPKETTPKKLPVQKIAAFLNNDSYNGTSNSDAFSTDSSMLERTIEHFMRDVKRMDDEQLEAEREREKRISELKKDEDQPRKKLDPTITDANGKIRENRKIKD